MKELRQHGRYFVALTAREYAAREVQQPNPSGIRWILTPPLDTTYPDSEPLLAMTDGRLYAPQQNGYLAQTTADLDFTGRYHDFTTNHAKAATAQS